MSSVKDVIAKLDAAKLQEEADRVARIKAQEEARVRAAMEEAQRLEQLKVKLLLLDAGSAQKLTNICLLLPY